MNNRKEIKIHNFLEIKTHGNSGDFLVLKKPKYKVEKTTFLVLHVDYILLITRYLKCVVCYRKKRSF